ncbi:hypothetical protein [Streptomyces sp. NPDC058268]|uniref:hypothetical protein n=1 Tax=Streptomyces sp. NPDC058268 TaxID=3346413 RepID=UPI0036E12EC8
MHQEQPQSRIRTGTPRRPRHWGRTTRLWTPAISTVITTAAAIYQAWHGQPPG